MDKETTQIIINKLDMIAAKLGVTVEYIVEVYSQAIYYDWMGGMAMALALLATSLIFFGVATVLFMKDVDDDIACMTLVVGIFVFIGSMIGTAIHMSDISEYKSPEAAAIHKLMNDINH